MPGRVGRKSKTDAAPARTRTSARHVEAPDEGPVTTLRTHICQIFAEAQKAVETHRKLLVSLRKIQKECCYEVQDQKQAHRQFADFEAGDFDEEVGRCALRALTIKKGEVVGDRIVKFLAMFLKRANQEGMYAIPGENWPRLTEGQTARWPLLMVFLRTKPQAVVSLRIFSAFCYRPVQQKTRLYATVRHR
jgi:condensin complex subunit 3